MSKLSLTALCALGLSLTACDFGGLNQNEQHAGNQDDGVNLSFGDIAVDPTGTYFLSRNGDDLVHANILTGGAKILPGVDSPVRLAFDHEAERVYLTLESGGGDELVAYDVRDRKAVWSVPIKITERLTTTHGRVSFPLIEVSEDNKYLVVTHKHELEILDITNGEVLRSEEFDAPVVDVDLSPDGADVIITTDHEWVGEGDDDDDPETMVISVPMDPDSPAPDRTEIKVPNCSDEVVVAPDGEHAFLAPTSCNKDPISVIDLGSGEFVKNLPGFGPVAMSPSGEEMVGFLDMEFVDEALFDDPDDIPTSGGRYHLMFVDASTLQYDFLALGEKIPRYAMTPDGKMLLVDSVGWFEDERLRVVDIAARSIEQVSGPAVQLDNFAVTSDSEHVFLLDDGLFDLDVPARDIDAVSVGFDPENINITPDDTYLLLRQSDTKIQVFDIASSQIVRGIEF